MLMANDNGAPLPIGEETDEMVYVPLAWIKNANWYYEGYFIQKERANKTQESLDEACNLATELLSEIAILETKMNTYKTIIIITGTVSLISIVFYIWK